MQRRTDRTYLILDGMPFVKDAATGKAWVFARTTSTWVPAEPGDWDAKHPNWPTWWEDKFADLPELPA